MFEKEYLGASASGDLTEALQDAIAQAKNDMKTDLISWRMADVWGENGGFMLSNSVFIRIMARVGPLASNAQRG